MFELAWWLLCFFCGKIKVNRFIMDGIRVTLNARSSVDSYEKWLNIFRAIAKGKSHEKIFVCRANIGANFTPLLLIALKFTAAVSP